MSNSVFSQNFTLLEPSDVHYVLYFDFDSLITKSELSTLNSVYDCTFGNVLTDTIVFTLHCLQDTNVIDSQKMHNLIYCFLSEGNICYIGKNN